MSDYDLRVLTDHLHELAARQRDAAGAIAIATSAVGNLTGRVWQTHGVACAATNMAVSTASEVRTAGGDKVAKVATELGQNLDYAASNYGNTDFREGRDIAACSV